MLVDNPPQHADGDFVLDGDVVRAVGAPRLTFAGIGVYRPALFHGVHPPRFPLAPVLAAAMAKWYATEAAQRIVDQAVQIHGGNGYMSEFRVEQLARDSKVLQIYAGTDEIQITHIARDLLSR